MCYSARWAPALALVALVAVADGGVTNVVRVGGVFGARKQGGKGRAGLRCVGARAKKKLCATSAHPASTTHHASLAPRHGDKTHAFCSTFLILKNLLPSHHQGPALTTKLLNASAALAAKPAVNATVTALQSGQADFEAAVDQLRGGPAAAKGVDTPTATDAALALSTLGGKCGAGVAKCLAGCCSPAGVCSLSSTACGPLCQAPYSAPLSPCASALQRPPPPETLPFVGPGAVCGAYVARCSTGCCNQLNYCEPVDGSFGCSISSCSLPASPNSASCAAVHATAKPVTRRFKFVATWGKAAPDGYEVDVVLVNGKYPAPTIWANAGDRIIVEYVNLLGQPSTIHWHGQKQINTNIMDGVDPVTQVGTPGLTVGRRRLHAAAGAGANVTDTPPPTYLYDFVTDSPGSYWWHDHSSALSYVAGLRGALIVSDPWSPVLPVYKAQKVVFLQDNYHELPTQLLQQYINSANSDGVEPVPKSFAINGLTGRKTPWCGGAGQPPCRTAVIAAGTLPACSSSPTTALSFVSGAAFAFMAVHLETTAPITASLVTLDGVVLNRPRPIFLTPAEPLILYPGQRAGVQFCSDDPAAAAAAGAKLIVRAPLNQFGTVTPNSNGLGLDGPGSIVDTAAAVITFGGDAPQTTADGQPLPPPGTLNAVVLNSLPPQEIVQGSIVNAIWGRAPQPDGDMLAPTTVPPPPATVSVPILLSTGFLSPTSPQYFFFNNITFAPPSQPAMLQTALSPGGLPPNAAPGTPGYNVLKFKYGDVVDFVINSLDTGPHPLHLHGQSFWVMAEGAPNAGFYDPATTPLRPKYVRDVAAIQAGSFLVIRFTVSHPLEWFFHCHIEWHLADGLALVVQTGP